MPRSRRRAAWILAFGALAAAACTRDFAKLSEGDVDGLGDAAGDRTIVGDVGTLDGGGGTDGTTTDALADVGTDAPGDGGVDACTACTGGACTIVCAGGCPCAPRNCTDPTCTFLCDQGATQCVVSSNASTSTNVTCKAGSTCKVTCEDTPCNVTCEPGAICQLTCPNAGGGDTCAIDCQGGTATSCGSGSGERRICRTSTCP